MLSPELPEMSLSIRRLKRHEGALAELVAPARHSRYGQRWQVKTVMSMLKRLLRAALRVRQYWSKVERSSCEHSPSL